MWVSRTPGGSKFGSETIPGVSNFSGVFQKQHKNKFYEENNRKLEENHRRDKNSETKLHKNHKVKSCKGNKIKHADKKYQSEFQSE